MCTGAIKTTQHLYRHFQYVWRVQNDAVACRNDDLYEVVRRPADDDMPTEHQHARYSFPAYAQGVRTLEVHGTPQQKLEYLFYGYALTCEGQINRDELVELMQAHCKRQPEPDEEEDITVQLDKVPHSATVFPPPGGQLC